MKLSPKYLVLAIWLFYKLLDILNYYLIFLNQDIDRSLERVATVQSIQAFLGVLFLNKVINFLDNKWLTKTRAWTKTIPLHIAIALLFAILLLAVSVVFEIALIYPVDIWDSIVKITVNNLPGFFKASLLSYNFLIGLYYGMHFYEKKKNEELIRRQVESQLLETRLLYLKSQLNPHFLFNSLHAISALMETDIRAARNLLADLSDLLRIVLEYDNVRQITIKDELFILNKYLAIERTRFPDSFKATLKVEESVEKALIPPFLLQPIVENSLKYCEQPDFLNLRIEISKKNDYLSILILDNGPGFSKDYKLGTGIPNTIDRLETLYSESATVVFGNQSHGGAMTKITIPLAYENSDR